MQGQEIKKRLRILLDEAAEIDLNLALRLDEINYWLRDLRPGTLTAKKLLSDFLLQLIRDSEIWLALKTLSPEQIETELLTKMTPTQKYWYQILFPKWLAKNDDHLYIWRQKLMTGEFIQEDEQFLNNLAKDIVNRGGSVYRRYIADLSMGTDLIVSHRQEKAICLQVTTLAEKYYSEKYVKWQETMALWHIERGLFVSYNPSENEAIQRLINITLWSSDQLKDGSYQAINC